MESMFDNPISRFGGGRRNVLAADVYVSDSPGNYFILDPAEFVDPSSLDGMTMVGGANKPWTDLTFGVHMDTLRLVVFRMRGYNTYNSSAPAGTSAFTNEFTDIGFYIQPNWFPAPGTYKAAAPISNAGIISPNNAMYVAFQYREPHLGPDQNGDGIPDEDGEGQFDPAYRHVYSAIAPQVGSSADNFWYDWDPLDGIYTNEEFDVLGDGTTTYPSNLLSRIQVNESGQEDTLVPISFTVVQGRNATGSFFDLWYSDDQYVQLRPALFTQAGVPPLQVRFESVAVATTAVSLKFRAEAASLNGTSIQKILLWNFAMGQYDLVDTRTATGTDTTTEVHITSNPSRYIDPTTRTVRALMQFSPGTFTGSAWQVRFDRTVWLVIR
jgi:hypothetical protein